MVARARMSAQETVALQDASTAFLIVSMTSIPRMELLLGKAFCSPAKVAVSANKIDASQPCKEAHMP